MIHGGKMRIIIFSLVILFINSCYNFYYLEGRQGKQVNINLSEQLSVKMSFQCIIYGPDDGDSEEKVEFEVRMFIESKNDTILNSPFIDIMLDEIKAKLIDIRYIDVNGISKKSSRGIELKKKKKKLLYFYFHGKLSSDRKEKDDIKVKISFTGLNVSKEYNIKSNNK